MVLKLRDRLMGFESHQLIVEKTDNTLCGCYLFLARPKGFVLRTSSFATRTVAFYVSRVSAKANRHEID